MTTRPVTLPACAVTALFFSLAAPALAAANLAFTRVSDVGLRALAVSGALSGLVLDGPGITDSGVRALAAARGGGAGPTPPQGRGRGRRAPPPPAPLLALELGGCCHVGDGGTAALAAVSSLTRLEVATGGVSDVGAAALGAARLPSLTRLALPRSRRLGDKGLARLVDGLGHCLQSLDVSGTGVSPAGVASLARAAALAHLVAPPTALRPGVVSALRADLPLLLHVKQL